MTARAETELDDALLVGGLVLVQTHDLGEELFISLFEVVVDFLRLGEFPHHLELALLQLPGSLDVNPRGQTVDGAAPALEGALDALDVMKQWVWVFGLEEPKELIDDLPQGGGEADLTLTRMFHYFRSCRRYGEAVTAGVDLGQGPRYRASRSSAWGLLFSKRKARRASCRETLA